MGDHLGTPGDAGMGSDIESTALNLAPPLVVIVLGKVTV